MERLKASQVPLRILEDDAERCLELKEQSGPEAALIVNVAQCWEKNLHAKLAVFSRLLLKTGMVRDLQ